MSMIPAGDSAYPQPTRYAGHAIWGVYVAGDALHVWTREEVAALRDHGIEGVLPIVVPPQGEEWWDVNFGYGILEKLVQDALAWGVPTGSPLCLDLEESQSSAMRSPVDVLHAWAVATRVHGLRTWTYGSAAALAADMWAFKWLADWPATVPSDPVPPEGITAWQYAGNVDGIDLSVFREGHDFLSPDLRVVTLPPAGEAAPSVASDTSPVPVGDSTAITVPGTGPSSAAPEALSGVATPPTTAPSSPEAESGTASSTTRDDLVAAAVKALEDILEFLRGA